MLLTLNLEMAGCADDVAAWLDKLGLTEYTDQFLTAGYSSLQQCVSLSKADLMTIGIAKLGHINRLFRDLETMKVDSQLGNSLLSSSPSLYYELLPSLPEIPNRKDGVFEEEELSNYEMPPHLSVKKSIVPQPPEEDTSDKDSSLLLQTTNSVVASAHHQQGSSTNDEAAPPIPPRSITVQLYSAEDDSDREDNDSDGSPPPLPEKTIPPPPPSLSSSDNESDHDYEKPPTSDTIQKVIVMF